MNTKCNFIVTKDKETADQLVACGLKMVANSDGVYTFANILQSTMNFSNIDVKKVVYTNMLSL